MMPQRFYALVTIRGKDAKKYFEGEWPYVRDKLANLIVRKKPHNILNFFVDRYGGAIETLCRHDRR